MTTRTVKTVVATFFSVSLMTGAPGLSITSPADGSLVTPGQNLAVTVAATGSFRQIVVVGEGPIGFSKVLTGSASLFSLPIPATLSPGQYSLTAIGAAPGGSVSSPPITISVERADVPVEVDVTPSILNLPVGQSMPLRVVGTYADGTKLDITHSMHTSFSSNATGVASVDTQGNVTALSPGAARIGVGNSLSVPVVVPATLALTPQWPVVYAKQSTQFSVFRPGMANAPVIWTINPLVGSINASGVYTAPAQITAQQVVAITATLKDDPTKSIATGITLYPPITITVLPSGPVPMQAGQTFRFGANLMNALDQNVVWSVSPTGAGSIDSSGLYIAPATVMAKQTVTITATAFADLTKTASASVLLLP